MPTFSEPVSKPQMGHKARKIATTCARLPPFLNGLTASAFVYRALLIGLLATLAVFSLTRLNKNLHVGFDLLTDHSGPFQVYHAGPDGVFNERNNFNHYALANTWQQQAFEINTLHDLAVLRLDPVTQAGRFSLGKLDISSRWGRLQLQGPALQAAMTQTHDLQVEGVEPGVLRLRATGADPYFHLNIPQALLSPRPMALVPRALVIGLLTGLLWWMLDQGSHRLKLAQPLLHGRLVQALRRGRAVPIIVCLGMTFAAHHQVDDHPILGDGIQNLLMAVNVFKHNTLSLDNNDHPKPTNFREPLPSLLIGLHLKVFAPEAVTQPFAAFRAGELTRTVKLANLVWLYAGVLGVWMTALRAGRSNLVGLAASLLAFQFFFQGADAINTLYTELATACMMVWCSYALLRAVQQQSLGWFLTSGILLGMLTLTKAAFIYIGSVSIGLLLLVLWRDTHKKRSNFARVLLSAGSMGLGFILVLAPWVARNEIQFDSARVNSRGELILWGRATLNNMTNDEVLGLIYDQAPTLYKRAVAGTRFAEHEGDYERGGRWQRLNRYQSSFWEADRMAAYAGEPDKAISFHFKAGAEATRRIDELTRQGHPNPDVAVGVQMKHEAWKMIQARPLRHIFMTAPFLWHGFWSLKPIELPFVSVATQEAAVELLNLAGGLALFGVFIRGLWSVNVPRVALTVLPVGMLLFYAFLTHNIHRYSTPTHPMMLLVLVLVLRGLWRRLFPVQVAPR